MRFAKVSCSATAAAAALTTTAILNAAAATGSPNVPTNAAERPSAVAPDTRSGHLYIAPTVGFTDPFGSAQSGVSQSQSASWGFGYGGSLALGISRYVLVEAWGGYIPFGAATTCAGCADSSSFGAGLGLQYHLVSGIPFDPWMGFGLGWRSTTLAQSNAPSATYAGLEWTRLTLGGDWYPTKHVGFGPTLALDLGTYTARPSSPIGDASVFAFFTAGARVVLDF